MSQFDPTMKRITAVYHKSRILGHDGKPCMEPAKYRYVSYDGEAERYLEPVNHMPQESGLTNMRLTVARLDGDGLVDRIEIFEGRIVNEVQAFF